MTVADLIEKLKAMNPAAQVRLEADFDGMTGSGDLAHVEYGDDGEVVLRDASGDGEPRAYVPLFTLEVDGAPASWLELREITQPGTREVILPGDPGHATLHIDIEADHFKAGETRYVKLTGHDGRTFYATCEGVEVSPGVTRVEFPLPPFE